MGQVEVLEIFQKEPNKGFTVKELRILLPDINDPQHLYRILGRLHHWNLILKVNQMASNHIFKHIYYLNKNKEGEKKWKKQDI